MWFPMWLGGILVKASDFWSNDRGFESRSRCC